MNGHLKQEPTQISKPLIQIKRCSGRLGGLVG